MPYYLDGKELEQFNAVVDCYRSHIHNHSGEGDLPEPFKTEEEALGYFGTSWIFSKKKKRVLYQYTHSSYYPHYWNLPASSLIPVKSALNTICAYQMSRKERLLGAGSLSDPTNLVCEQLKTWLSGLSRQDISNADQVKQEIGGYVSYIKSLEKNRVFPATTIGLRHERTMNSMLLEVSNHLQKAVQEVDDQMQRKSLSSIVSNITKYSTSAVDNCVQYLFYIYRGNKTPAAVSIQHIRSGNYSDLEKIKKTRSFKLLEVLTNSPYVRRVNQEYVSEICPNDVISHHTQTMSISKNDELFNSDSPAARGRCHLNKIIGGNLIPDRNLTRRWFSQVHSGINLPFQMQQHALKAFVHMHSVVEKLAQFSLICRFMEDLVDYFGAKMWAENGDSILSYFQEAFRRFNVEFRQTVETVHETARNHYHETMQRNHKQSFWQNNYNTADRIYDVALRDMELSLAEISQIPMAIDRIKTPQYDEQIRRKLSDVVYTLNDFGRFFKMNPLTCKDLKPLNSDQIRFTNNVIGEL